MSGKEIKEIRFVNEFSTKKKQSIQFIIRGDDGKITTVDDPEHRLIKKVIKEEISTRDEND